MLFLRRQSAYSVYSFCWGRFTPASQPEQTWAHLWLTQLLGERQQIYFKAPHNHNLFQLLMHVWTKLKCLIVGIQFRLPQSAAYIADKQLKFKDNNAGSKIWPLSKQCKAPQQTQTEITSAPSQQNTESLLTCEYNLHPHNNSSGFGVFFSKDLQWHEEIWTGRKLFD